MPRPQSLVPRTLSTLLPARVTSGSRSIRAVARLHVDDPLRRERLEVAGEEAGADHVVERVEQPAGPLRQHLVDLGEHQRAAHHRRHPVDPRARDRDAERPGHDQHRAGAERGAADRVDGTHRLPGDPVADLGAAPLQQPLPERGGQDHDEQRTQRHQQRRVRVAERDRRQPDAEEAAEQQPRGGEGAGDEALPVAGDGVGHHQHRRAASRGGSSAAPLARTRCWAGRPALSRRPTSMYAGSSCSGASGRSSIQPRYSKSRAITPAVNPQQMTSLSGPIRKPGLRQPAGPRDGDPVRRGRAARRSAPGRPRAPRRARHACTALGSRHQASTGVTEKLLGGSHSGGSSAKTVDPGGHEPGLLLGLAQRGLAARSRRGRPSRRGRTPGRGASASCGCAR